jgi:hypothetical protein
MTRPHDGRDTALRAKLHAGLDPHGADHSEALQERVLAQWRLRHPAQGSQPATAAGPVLGAGGAGRRPLWWATGVLLAAALLVTASPWQRPDPTLDELMQIDVLTLMSMGEI